VLLVLTETIAGFSILPRAAQKWADWQVLRPTLTLRPLDEADAASLLGALRRAGRQLGTIDALIATAVSAIGVLDRVFAHGSGRQPLAPGDQFMLTLHER